MKIDYNKLYPGIVIGTTSMSPLAMAIRTTTTGIKNIFNLDISTHVMIVCKDHDLFYGMEMNWPKIRNIDLNKIGHISFIGGNINKDNYELQDKCNDWLWKSHSIGIRYDIKELFKFWGLPVYDDPKKYVCSDLVREMYKCNSISYPDKWNDKCSPYHIQKYVKIINK